MVNRPTVMVTGDLRCPRCFARDVVPSLRRGLIDEIMRRFGRGPRQCRVCGRRFFVRETVTR